MFTAAEAIAALDEMLALNGADVKIRRTGVSDVSCKARVKGLTSQTVRPGSSTTVGNYRAVISPSPLSAASFPLPLRTTDKLVFNGQERVINFACPQYIGTTIVRYDIDFTG